ncbi:MAG: hypothetical protein JWM10_579 [Myxococcaceae bacterium]|nr:hypothetical protein [Myxococcaceae bacterium]
MKRFLGLAFAVTLAASPLASAQPSPAAPHVTPPVALQQPAPTPPTPPPGGALCCCRAWSHGWQYSWRDNAACTAANGTCVSPDHC